MKIMVKSAGNGLNQDYWWYELCNDNLVRKSDFEIKDNKDFKFYFKKTRSYFEILINSKDESRKDNWNRSIKNSIYITGKKEEFLKIKGVIQLYLKNRKYLFQLMNQSFTSSQSDIGFNVKLNDIYNIDIKYNDTQKLEYIEFPYAIASYDSSAMKSLLDKLDSENKMLIIETSSFEDISKNDIDKTIIITDEFNKNDKKCKNYKRKKKYKSIGKLLVITIGSILTVDYIFNKKGR